MFTKVIVVAAALTAAVATTVPAQADTNLSIGLGFGGFHGHGYYPGYYPVYGGYGYYDGISCGTAKKIVKNHGFYKVYATNCSGKVMRFKGKKAGDWYSVKVHRKGYIVDVDEL
jgi:hypothetical protein